MSSKGKRVTAPAKKGKAPAKPATGAAAGSSKVADDQPPILEGTDCELRRMVDVLIEDKTKEVEKSKRWPLLIDLHGAAVTFLRHRDTNYLSTLNSREMDHETVRKALIGAIRFGKPLVIDMLDTDTFDVFENAIAGISPNLLQDLLSKDLLENENYLKLVKPEDGELYSEMTNEFHSSDFKLIIATNKNPPGEKLQRLFFPVRVR